MNNLLSLRANRLSSLAMSHVLFFGVFGVGEYYVYTYNADCHVSGFTVWALSNTSMLVGYILCVLPALIGKSSQRALPMLIKAAVLVLIVVFNLHLRSRYFSCFYFGGTRKAVLADPMLNLMLLSVWLAAEYSLLLGSWLSFFARSIRNRAAQPARPNREADGLRVT